ncbi:unnamed protein product [Owenia fusiformis]|uniref:Dipeptidyl peptidase 1 n=1 Tax=Owenia fusiformis TaxID=6347 RepID=A0A8J1XFS8_OWEFU|nr:unnamed protein product [Owenia fusiformis]
MSGGTTTRYEEIGADRPLFGEARPRDRVANLIVGAFTALVVTVTVVSGFIFPAGGPKGVNIYFACCIVFILGSHLILIYWYRQVVTFSLVYGDTPANCTYPEIQGTWIFQIGKGDQGNTIKCNSLGPVVRTLKVDLTFPDVAVDQDGNKGFWTLIYNQGFEVVINSRKYFAFSKYEGKGENATSYCDETMPGWSHNIDEMNWACFKGKKQTALPPKHMPPVKKYNQYQMYRNNMDLVRKINSVQSSWKAAPYDEHETFNLRDIVRRNGGKMSKIHSKPVSAPITQQQLDMIRDMPDAFDWRNVNGTNYVSPVRNQGGCGSCYAFSSMGMLEGRLRVETKLKKKDIFSPQDVVECSEYAQGCEGGFPYLIAGKYAEDFGAVDEQCNVYKGRDGPCQTKKTCGRTYSTDYHYVGGYYGACNEALMIKELVTYGPTSVSFEVYPDFMHYRHGIYHHTGLMDKFNPFEITNHAVLLVGYGADKMSGEKYWIVKNSWGTGWGEDGFFRIKRGADECAIESIAVGAKIYME